MTNVANGQLFEAIVDYQTAGPNVLSLVRYSNNQIYDPFVTWNGGFVNILTHFGNFRSNYDSFLFVPSGAAYVDAVMADDKNFHFIPDGKGGWVGPHGIDAQLVQSGTTWKLTDWNDTVYTYSAYFVSTNILLTSITDRNGYTRKITYDAQFDIAAVTDSYGRTLKFSGTGCSKVGYPDQCKTNSVTTPDGLVLTYGYGGPGLPSTDLTSVTYSTSPKTSQTYSYDTVTFTGFLNGIVDEDGDQLAAWTYEGGFGDDGFVATSQGAGGADLTTFNWGEVAPKTTVTVVNALGQQTLYGCAPVLASLPNAPQGAATDVAAECPTVSRLNAASAPIATENFTFDSNLYTASETDWNGNKTTYVNNARGEPLTITEAVGTPQQRATTITYHAQYRLPLQIVEPGLTTNFTYDASGNLLKLAETDTTKQSSPYSTNGSTRTWSYSWADFLPTSVTDPRGGVTRFAWDSTGALASVTDALAHVTRITKHLPGGWPETIVDPNGVETDLAYDARQRLVSSTVHTASGLLTTTYTRDAVGNVIAVTLPDGARLTFTYDSAHRLIGVTDLFGQKVTYTLDALGDTTKTTVLGAGGGLARLHSATFDTLGRMLQDIGGAGQTTSFAYDENGNRVSITDPLGRVTGQTFDALNRATRITDPAKGVTAIAYDAQDRPVSITDPNGNVTRYVYDGFGDVIETVSPDSLATVFHYNAAGSLVQKVDARSIGVAYSYDLLGRLTAATYAGATGEDVAYSYDEASGGFGVGRLTTVADAAGTLKLRYDERGNVVGETRTQTAGTLVTSYGYDKASRLASIVYPSGAELAYARDRMGRITGASVRTSAASTAVSVVSGVGYAPFGPIVGLTYGNGIAETRAFDRDYRLTGIAAAGTAAVQKLSYTYNAADNVVSITDGLDAGNNRSFGYDALDRLSQATDAAFGTMTYAYDPVGNRLTQAQQGGAALTYTYVAHSNRLAAVKQGSTQLRAFTYALDGNITQDARTTGTFNLVYNHADRIAAVTNAGTALATYGYDAFGQRLRAQVTQGAATLTTLFQYDRAGHLIEEAHLAAGGAAQRLDYVYLGDRPVARFTANTSEIDFQHDDRLDTPQLVTHAGQNAVWSGTYQPFGSVATTGAFVEYLRFPGQYADTGTGYYHNGFRDYDPTLGRYVESDPIGLAGGLNSYAYAADDPLKLVDPSGLKPKTCRVCKVDAKKAEITQPLPLDSNAKFTLTWNGFNVSLSGLGGVVNVSGSGNYATSALSGSGKVASGTGLLDTVTAGAWTGSGPTVAALGAANFLEALLEALHDQVGHPPGACAKSPAGKALNDLINQLNNNLQQQQQKFTFFP